ncbi:hypothetical protein C0585_04970 [Candidatus Woesearchaeota archaeon]|nr:MAG: hypothetical protein C0585_04970 [Candidatus Woesearchaeota archaeon]
MEHKIDELVKVEYDTIQSDETVKDAVAKFAKDTRPRTLLVFDDENRYVGVVTERIIFRSGNQSDHTKVKNLAVKAPKLEKDTDIFHAAKLMLDSNMKHLPVFDGESILGIVTANDVLMKSIEATNIGDLPIRRFMSGAPRIVQADEKIATVMHLFNEAAISRVPVVKDGKPVGIVSKHDIVTKVLVSNNTMSFADFDDRSTLLNNGVDSIMGYPLRTLMPNDTVEKAISLMHERSMNSVILVDAEDKLSGIVTKKDLLEPLAAIVSHAQEQKRFIQLRGQANELEPHIKAEVINEFDELLKRHEEQIGEGHAFIYVKKHKGRLNKGKTRGVDMYYIRARISSDFGTFVASNEEFGVVQCANEVARLLEKQMQTTLERMRDRSKGEDMLGVRAAI